MKKLLMIAALAVSALATAPQSLQAQHLDGAWLADANYGGHGDTVVNEVKTQIADYADAKASAEAAQENGADLADITGTAQAAADTALYSWVKADYLAEKGRVLAVAGKNADAFAAYKQAEACALTAKSVDCNEESKTVKSHEQGALIYAVIEKALSRLAAK